MNRRTILKTFPLTGFSLSVAPFNRLLPTSAPDPKAIVEAFKNGRSPAEQRRDSALQAKSLLTAHERSTLVLLCDIILPADGPFPSASQVGVPAFIEFMLKDQPALETPVRGGIQWLDHECRSRFGQPFANCSGSQRIAVVDDIAYPRKAKPEHAQGVAFFNQMRNLTASGYYTSKAGIAAIGYQGNIPHQWAGPPQEVLDQLGLSFDPTIQYADMV